MAGTTRRPKKRETERLIRIHLTNHTLIHRVKRKWVKDSRNLHVPPLTVGGGHAAFAWGRSARFSMARWHHNLSEASASSETQNMSSPAAAATAITGPSPDFCVTRLPRPISGSMTVLHL